MQSLAIAIIARRAASRCSRGRGLGWGPGGVSRAGCWGDCLSADQCIQGRGSFKQGYEVLSTRHAAQTDVTTELSLSFPMQFQTSPSNCICIFFLHSSATICVMFHTISV